MIAQDRQPYLNTRQDAPFQFFGSPTVMRSTGDTTDNHFCLMEHLSMPPGLASPSRPTGRRTTSEPPQSGSRSTSPRPRSTGHTRPSWGG